MDIEQLSTDPRVRVRCNGQPAHDGTDMVYRMQRAQRATDTPALETAVAAANALGKPAGVVAPSRFLQKGHHAARTIRPRIHAELPAFLQPIRRHVPRHTWMRPRGLQTLVPDPTLLDGVPIDHGRGILPLVVPLTLVRHCVGQFAIACLQARTYLEPHPKEPMLRNHV